MKQIKLIIQIEVRQCCVCRAIIVSSFQWWVGIFNPKNLKLFMSRDGPTLLASLIYDYCSCLWTNFFSSRLRRRMRISCTEIFVATLFTRCFWCKTIYIISGMTETVINRNNSPRILKKFFIFKIIIFCDFELFHVFHSIRFCAMNHQESNPLKNITIFILLAKSGRKTTGLLKVKITRISRV